MSTDDLPNLKTIIKLIKIGGQWNDPSDSIYLKVLNVLRHVYEVVVCVLSILAIFTSGIKRNLGLVMLCSVVGTVTNWQSCYFYFNHSRGLKLLKMFEKMSKSHKTKWEIDMYKQTTSVFWRTFNMNIVSTTILLVGYLLIPVTVDTLVYVIPGFNGVRVPLPLQGFLDMDPARDFKYYMITLSSITWSITSVVSSIGNQSLLSSFCVFQCAEVEIFCRKLKDYTDREEEKYAVGNLADADTLESEEELKTFALNHQEIVNVGQDLRLYFGFPFALQNTLISGSLCLLIYACLTETNRDFVLYFTNIFCLSMILGTAGMACFMGENLDDQSANMFNAVYELPWYRQGPRLRKYTYLMLLQSSRHMKIDYYGLLPLSLHMLMQILNTAYSYVMLLKSLF